VSDDDRVSCATCREYRTASGFCGIAAAGKRRDVGPKYAPWQGAPRRCEFYLPRAADPDQRPGWKRWPLLAAEYRERFPPRRDSAPTE
jgi:hypothetical protein